MVYDPTLVFASFAVALLTAYTALSFGARLAGLTDRARPAWLAFGAFTMGSGIWTMHFVGMQAHLTFADMSYGAGLTFLSWLSAVLASALALHLIGRDSLPSRLFFAASLIMGAGIVAMHYVGMYAMNMSLAPVFNSFYLTLSVVIAVIASGAALSICRFVRRLEGRNAIIMQFISALIMAAAICGMHYTGMIGMSYPDGAVPAADNVLGGSWMGIPLAIIAGFFLFIVIVVTASDIRYARTVEREDREAAKWVYSAAFEDKQTGLSNRAAIEKSILNEIALPEPKQSPFALVYMEIANYREMMASMTNFELNQATRQIANEIDASVDGKSGCEVARYSSSAFMIMIRRHEDSDRHQIFTRLRGLSDLKTESGAAVFWRVGQSVYPESGLSSRRLIRASMVTGDVSEIGNFSQLADDPTLVGAS